MTRTRVTAIVLGGALLTSWLVAAAGPFRQPLPVAVPPPPKPSGIDTLAATVQAQADRLRTRLDQAPAPRELVRNPFTFAPARRRGTPREVVAAAVDPPRAAPAPIVRPAPPVALVAIATDAGSHRAVLSVGGELAVVSVGDTIAARYRVLAISADVVELADDRGGPVVRLALR